MEFKVGDKVRVTKCCSSTVPGELYTVFEHNGNLYVNKKGYIENSTDVACSCEQYWEKVSSGSTKFEVGDVVRQTRHGSNTDSLDNGKITRVTAVGGRYLSRDEGNDGIKIDESGFSLQNGDWRGESCFELVSKTTTKKEGSIMKKAIANAFEKTDDALLVEKHLGAHIDGTFRDELFLKEHVDEYLKEAQKMQEEEDERNEK